MINDSDLLMWASGLSLVWFTSMSLMLIYLNDQVNKLRASHEREQDLINHLKDQIIKIETKQDVKEAIEEAAETIRSTED